jgi:T5orf172 domain
MLRNVRKSGAKVKKLRPGTIYFIHAQGTNRYKIGLTTRPYIARLKQLNSTQSAYPLVTVKTILVRDVNTAEKLLHHQFANYRRHGEWFEFNRRQVKQVCREMSKIAGKKNYVFQLKHLIVVLASMVLASFTLTHCQQQQSTTIHKQNLTR